MGHQNDARLLKNIPARTLQLSLIGLLISIGISVYFFMLGLMLSCVMVGCFSALLLFILLLQLSGIVRDAHLPIISCVCLLLIVSGFIEGSSTGQYLFFFPLIVVIPIVVDNRNSSKRSFVATFAMVCLSFAICLYLGHAHQPIEKIDASTAQKIIYSNAASSMATTLLFAVANIVYERRFIRALNTIAYIQSHEMRKPVASIIGLMDVWKGQQYEYDPEIVAMIEYTVAELDEKIQLIEKHTNYNIENPQRLPVDR